jgi:hypothetical protein
MSDERKIVPKAEPSEDWAINFWFEGLIDHIRTDHFMYTTGAVTAEKKKFYDDVILGDGKNMFSEIRETSSKYFISSILNDYLKELESFGIRPLKLSMALSDSKILVWAEINDNDEATEDALLISEAKVNGKYYEKGFYLNSTIIEKSDNLSTPPHYQKIIE